MDEHYYLHGFSFETEEQRQAAATGHHLWPGFETWWNHRYDGVPDINDSHCRELFEAYIEGGWQESQQPKSNPAP